jgi:hypothetical protein
MAATTAAVVGITSALVSSGMSFRQAAKQNQLAKEAQRAQAEAEADARKRLSQNAMKGLAIQKEPYELQREALLSAGGQAIEAGIESDRGAAATAGRIFEQQAQEQGRVRSAMGQELTGIDRLVRGEESRLADMGMGLEMMKLEGAQLAEADAMKARRQSREQGFQGITSAVQQGAAAAPLYFKTQGARAYEDAIKFASETGVNDIGVVAAATPGLEATKGMTPLQLQDFISQNPERGKLLLESLQTRGGLGVDSSENILTQKQDPFLDFLTIGQPFNYTK